MSDQRPESGIKRILLLGEAGLENLRFLMTAFIFIFVLDSIPGSRAEESQPLGGSSPPAGSTVVNVNEQTNSSEGVSQPLGGSSPPPGSTVVNVNEQTNSSEGISQPLGGSSPTPASRVTSVNEPTDTDNQSTTLQNDSSLVLVPGELLKLNKMMLVISGAAAYAVSPIWPKAANVVAFTATLIAARLSNRWRKTTLILTKFGAMACAFGILAALATVLSEKYRWYAVGLPFVTIAAAVYAWHP